MLTAVWHCETVLSTSFIILTSVTAVACEDKHSHCEQYGKSVCSHFKQWAAENCAKFCDLCSHRSKRKSDQPTYCELIRTSVEAVFIAFCGFK